MFGIVAVAFAVGIAGLLAYASRGPDAFVVRRSTRIGAPASRVFSLLQDFRLWKDWSPWETIDSDLKREYGGASSGKGATYAWSGKKAGAGSMEIVGLAPPERLDIKLDFTRPIKASNRIEFRLSEDAEGTRVDWEMMGNNGLVSKVMGVFINMDQLVGRDFERGLAQLKAAAEERPGTS